MKRFFLFFIFSLYFSAFSLEPYSHSSNEIKAKEYPQKGKDLCTYTIFQLTDNTWCYDIFKNKKLFIHQTCIPGLPGNEGFKEKADAEKVARLVIEKITNGEAFPTITKEELEKLKVVN